MICLLSTLVMTFPVGLRLTSHLAGSGGDGWVYLWNHWWMGYVIRHPGVHLFRTGMLFYPEQVGLYTTTLTLASCAFMLPVQWISGPLLAANLYFLFSFWLAGFGTYLLARYLVRDHGAALVAAFAFAFCPYMTAHALGHFNLIATGWIPLFFLCFLRSQNEDGWSQPALAALFLIIQLYTEFILGIFAGLLAIGWVLASGPAAWKILKATGRYRQVLAVIGVSGIALLPYYLAARHDPDVANLISRNSWFGANEHGAALVGYFLPSELHPFWHRIVTPIAGNFYGAAADHTVYLGWVTLVLAVVGLFRNRRLLTARVAAVLAVVFALLALGPTLHFVHAPVLNVIRFQGLNITPGLPYPLFHIVPILRQLRIPSRFILLTMLMLALLAAYGTRGIAEIVRVRRTPRTARVVAALCGLLVLLDFTVAPFATADARVPPLYRQLRNLPEGVAVWDLPFGVLDGLTSYGTFVEASLKALDYQTIHEHPILTGYISRMPPRVIAHYRQVPLIDEIATRLQPGAVARPCTHASADAAEQELASLRIGAVVLHRNALTPDVNEFVRRHLQGGTWVHDGDLDLYYPRWMKVPVP